MTSVVELSASNPDSKRGILRTQIFWQLTHQFLANATDPLAADSWLYTTESKFGLLHYTEYQKTLYATQQLRGTAGAWWTSYIAPYMMITLFHGVNSVLPFVHTTYLWVYFTTS
jgi:hypothetical protein